MGRLGGSELSYSSDADVLFVYEPPAGTAEDAASGTAHQIAEELRRLLAAPSPEPPLGIDADLRPEGRQGPLVRSLAAYERYYAEWSRIWEAQALLRARFVCGDRELGEKFLALANRVRYPARGLTAEQITEIRRIKARVDTERLPRGADPATHAKLGRGGLADVEWTVQLLQLRHAHDGAGAAHASNVGRAGRGPGGGPRAGRRRGVARRRLAHGHPRAQRAHARARAAERSAAPAGGRAGRRGPGDGPAEQHAGGRVP